jgi:hypothetical protein
MNVQKKE